VIEKQSSLMALSADAGNSVALSATVNAPTMSAIAYSGGVDGADGVSNG
jgi:hypothetical protein